MNLVLSAGELCYLAMLKGATEIYGIEDLYFGKTGELLSKMVAQAAGDCLQKSLCTMDFEGIGTLRNDIEKPIGILAFPESFTEVIVRNTKRPQTRRLIFRKEKDTAILKEQEGGYALCDPSDTDQLKTEMQILFSEGCMVKREKKPFTLTHQEFSEIGTKAGAFRGFLREKGVGSVTTRLIAEAMAGRAGYFSAATVYPITKQHCTPISYLADSGVVLQIQTTPEREVAFTPMECEAAFQTAAAFIGGDILD